MPNGGMEALENTKPDEIVACQYDFVCNGLEMASGGERNYNPVLLKKAFSIAGYDESVVESKFPSLYQAFQYGAPPHAGMAPGIETNICLLKKNLPNILEEGWFEVVSFDNLALQQLDVKSMIDEDTYNEILNALIHEASHILKGLMNYIKIDDYNFFTVTECIITNLGYTIRNNYCFNFIFVFSY